MIRVASYNVENLFDRPKALDPNDWSVGRDALKDYEDVNALLAKATYTASDKQRIRDLFVDLDIYRINSQGAVRRVRSQSPRWAWFRKNRGTFDSQPRDSSRSVQITASGRSEWIGWVELSKEPVDAVATQMTARVIRDVNADILGLVEADNRPALVRYNRDMLGRMYNHLMLIDGNDDRGIDLGLMTKQGFTIESIRSNVDTADSVGTVFSRDCPQYTVRTPQGTVVHLLLNHFKSQSGGGGEKRRRQAAMVRAIVDRLVAQQEHVIVLGDLNEGPAAAGGHATNLSRLYGSNSPLLECYRLPGFSVGARPGTYGSCGIRNRLDYIFISRSLVPHFSGGGVFRNGLWGNRKTRPTAWSTYPSMTRSSHQGSDHAAVYVDLDI